MSKKQLVLGVILTCIIFSCGWVCGSIAAKNACRNVTVKAQNDAAMPEDTDVDLSNCETTMDMREKIQAEYEKYETEMNAVLEKLKNKASVNGYYDRVVKAQKAWQKYDKIDCDFAYDTLYNQELHGTSGGVELALIRLDRLKNRVEELRCYWAEAQDYWDEACGH